MSGGWDGYVRICDTATGEPLAALPTEFVQKMAFSGDGRRAVAGARRLRHIDLESGETLGSIDAPSGSTCVAMAPDGQVVVFGRTRGSIVQCRVTDGGVGISSHPIESGDVQDVAYSPDGRLLAIAGSRGRSALCRASDGVVVHRFDAGQALCVVFTPDGRTLYVGTESGDIHVIDVETATRTRVMHGPVMRVFALAVSPDGRALASGGTDGVVRIWDAATGDLQLRLRGHRRYVHDVAFSPDGHTLVSASGDGSLRLWSTRSQADRVAELRAVRSAEPAALQELDRRLAAGATLDEVHAALDRTPLDPLARRALSNVILKAASR